MSECRCATEGDVIACRRAGVPMTPALHQLCRTRADFRALWDRQPAVESAGPQKQKKHPGVERLANCTRRRRALRTPDGKPARRYAGFD